MTWTTTLKRGEGVAIDEDVLRFDRVESSLTWWTWRSSWLCVLVGGQVHLGAALVEVKSEHGGARVNVSVDALDDVKVRKV